MTRGPVALAFAMIAGILLIAAPPSNASFYSFVPDPADCGPSGDCSCPSGENCSEDEAGGGWNPTFICPFEENDTLGTLLLCLADGYEYQFPPSCPPTTVIDSTTSIDDPDRPSDLEQNPPGGDPDQCTNPQNREEYTVTPLPSPLWGLKIVRDDNTETDRLIAWENIASILETSIQVERVGLVARIGQFTEKPARQGGVITVTLNDHSVVLNTALYSKADHLTSALVNEFKLIGFRVVQDREYIYILNSLLTTESLTRLSMRSTDPSVISTRLALLPFAETGLDLLGVHGPEGAEGTPTLPGPELSSLTPDPAPGVDDTRSR